MSFEQNTRQNLKPMGAMPFLAGGNQTQTLPRVGYLARLYVHVSLVTTVTVGTGTAAVSTKGPWNYINRVRLRANTVTDIFNTTGYGAFLMHDISNIARTPEASIGRSVAGVSPQVFSNGAANGANAVEFGFTIPVALNDRDNAGMILLQMETITAQLSFDWAQPYGLTNESPVVVTGNATASTVGNAYAMMELFSIPSQEADLPDLRTVHQVIETSYPVFGVGADTVVNLMRANLYLRVLHYVTLNGALDTSFMDRMQLRYNNAETPYDLTRSMALQIQRARYGDDLPAGTYVFDMFYQGLPGFGGPRDIIAGGAVAELQSLISINSGATLGSGNNFVNTISQQIVNLNNPSAS